MIKIKSLKETSFDELYEAFSAAFADYDAPTITKEALAVMLERRGFSSKHSFGAFDDEKLVSFTFNGIGTHNGKKTVYDTGTGTIEEYRGRKLASRVFEESIPFLKNEGVEQYLLEVLQHNTPAFNIYKNQGFEITREFNYYFIDTKEAKIASRKIPEAYFIKEAEFPNIKIISSFWDFRPSWQNSEDAIERRRKDFEILGVYKENLLVGYGVIDPNSGDITQLAVEKGHRRLGIASALIGELIKRNKYPTLKIVNTQKGYTPMEKFIRTLGIAPSGYQYEMIKKL